MRKITKKKIKQVLTEEIATISLILCVVLFVAFWTFWSLSDLSSEKQFCDYDSCSQEATSGNWNYSGSSCFDNNNHQCQDFLRFWNACQDYKRRIGVC